MLGDRRYCYPLTISDFNSRYLMACEALETTKEEYAFEVFARAFKEYGLPRAIRTDNGVPFSRINLRFFEWINFVISCPFFSIVRILPLKSSSTKLQKITVKNSLNLNTLIYK